MMAYVTLLFATVFAFLIALFAVQNSMIVSVNLLVWTIEASLVIVILGAASLGFLMALSLQFYAQLKLRYQLYKANSRIRHLEDEIVRLQPAAPVEQQGPAGGTVASETKKEAVLAE